MPGTGHRAVTKMFTSPCPIQLMLWEGRQRKQDIQVIHVLHWLAIRAQDKYLCQTEAVLFGRAAKAVLLRKRHLNKHLKAKQNSFVDFRARAFEAQKQQI